MGGRSTSLQGLGDRVMGEGRWDCEGAWSAAHPQALGSTRCPPSLVLHLKVLKNYAEHTCKEELLWGPLLGWGRHCGDQLVDYHHPNGQHNYLFPCKEGKTVELYPLDEAPRAMAARTRALLLSLHLWTHERSVQGLAHTVQVTGSTRRGKNILAR